MLIVGMIVKRKMVEEIFVFLLIYVYKVMLYLGFRILSLGRDYCSGLVENFKLEGIELCGRIRI